MSLRDEIKKCLNNFYGSVEGCHVPPIMEEEHNQFTDEILKIFEKRIDSIEYGYDMEWHCCSAVDYAKNEMKKILKS